MPAKGPRRPTPVVFLHGGPLPAPAWTGDSVPADYEGPP
jgi:pimeloyl-ACP methyl ester carboxylesterase